MWTRLWADSLESVAPTTSYGAPRIHNVTGPGAVNASTYGGETVHVIGQNFGPPDNQSVYFGSVRFPLGLVGGLGNLGNLGG